MSESAELLAIAGRLAAAAGLPAPVALDRLEGGRNNRVFRVILQSGELVVLKSYYRDLRDDRDRLGAEWAFTRFAWDHGIREIPRPLAADLDSNCGLYSYVQGRKLAAGAVDEAKIEAAVRFVEKLNADPGSIASLAPASEACFTIARHLATIEGRVARLDGIDAAAPYRREAEDFVSKQLKPVWTAVRAAVLRDCARLGLSADDALGADERCASPSDFGFHNALVDGAGRVTFLDFEYAGQDDPAKLIADFFCQPEIPVPFRCFDRFADAVMSALGLGSPHRERARLLLDAYRVKWLCIMLNDFVPGDAARRAFSARDAWATRCADRLAQAAAAIELIGTAADSSPL